MVGRMHSVSQKSDRGENRMTEEERMREVERISRRTKESVKFLRISSEPSELSGSETRHLQVT